MADTKTKRLQKSTEQSTQEGTPRTGFKLQDLSGRGKTGWWATEPRLGRVAHGVAHRVDRLKAIGNGQVPRVVEVAWKVLSD